MIVKTFKDIIADGKNPENAALPLQGARIIDVGCGAGFVAEPMAEFGARVTAVDMVPEIIKVAQTHWIEKHGESSKGPEYICTPVETLAIEREGQYDMLLCLEVNNQSINQPTNQPINQSVNQSTNQSINQSINQSTNQSINQSINRSINWLINQPINQSIQW